jgi:hypothetical protein
VGFSQATPPDIERTAALKLKAGVLLGNQRHHQIDQTIPVDSCSSSDETDILLPNAVSSALVRKCVINLLIGSSEKYWGRTAGG